MRVAGQVAVVVVKGGRCLGWLVSRLSAVHVNLNVTRCTGRTRTNRYLKKLTRSGGAGGTVWVDLVVRLFGALCSRPPPDPQSVSASTLALHRPCSLLWPSFPGPSCLLPTFPPTPPPPLPSPSLLLHPPHLLACQWAYPRRGAPYHTQVVLILDKAKGCACRTDPATPQGE